MKNQLLIVLLLGLLLGTAGAGVSAVNISGTWAFSVNLEGGPQNVPMSFVFKQEGEKLTGTQSGGSGDPKVTGTVKGNKVVFNVEGKNRSGDPYKNAYTGTIESPTKMTGTRLCTSRPVCTSREQSAQIGLSLVKTAMCHPKNG